ncbi:serine/threonine protein kinase [Spirulina sp. CS-785/01]|uniref:serine/threonine protein kinase n=1 Tax=Spirulina sp. CS-785/01 TaxID=3021716 RepID=UPI00232F7948|nr:serine/threonine protein kinase [Spirulina sp. CS-785/01]MDB9315488.1 serine/threonine protein kinase [Spirulina sp. CS-785/01]
MSYCINPDCPQPEDPVNRDRATCLHCESSLLICDRYRVVKLINENSGFAKIYQVEESGIQKILKTLKRRHNSNPKAVDLFRQEAIVLSQLNHPGIPKVETEGYFQYYPHNSSDPLHCFIMEKIDGPTLREWMFQQGNLLISEQQALDWLKQIAEILHLVHSKNYFHRDIKLQNIMMRSTGQLVLIDFGTAREMTYTYLAQVGSSGNITRVSSAGYTPPEQQKGHAVPQSDFYALGRTFVYLLTGKQLEDSEIYDPYTDEFNWRNHAPDISPELADFIDRLMAHRAADRPRDTQEILDSIAQIRQNIYPHPSMRGFERIPTTEIQFSPDSPTIPEEHLPEESLEESIEESTSPKWLLGLLLPFLLLIGGAGGFWVYQWVTPLLMQAGRVEQQDQAIQHLEDHTSFVNDVVISPDGNWLISASADKTLKIWDINTGELKKTLDGHTSFVDEVVISPDGGTLVSISADKTVRIWDFPAGTARHVLEGHSGFIHSVAIASDGQTLVTGSADKTIQVWNLDTGENLYTLTGHSGFVNAVKISADSQILASCSNDKTIKIWNLATGEALRTIEGHEGFVNDLAISSDGTLLVSASADHTVRLWQVETGKELYKLTGHENTVEKVKINETGQVVFSSSQDQTIRLWDTKTGKMLQVLENYEHHIDYFAVSPDGHFVATGSGGNMIQLWRIKV